VTALALYWEQAWWPVIPGIAGLMAYLAYGPLSDRAWAGMAVLMTIYVAQLAAAITTSWWPAVAEDGASILVTNLLLYLTAPRRAASLSRRLPHPPRRIP
jgi:hypothetical protein